VLAHDVRESRTSLLPRLHSTRQSSLAYHETRRSYGAYTLTRTTVGCADCRVSPEIPSIPPAATLVPRLTCILNYRGENEGNEGCPTLVAALHWIPLLDAMACACPSPMARLIDCKRYVHGLSIEPYGRSAHCSPPRNTSAGVGHSQSRCWVYRRLTGSTPTSATPISTARVLLVVALYLYWTWPLQGMTWPRRSYISARCRPNRPLEDDCIRLCRTWPNCGP